jgi:Txe/YoeB family toxin of Txe-Axe toxin-antitoxin module
MNPRLQCTYIFLTEEERKLFATKKLEYIVKQIQEYNFTGINSREKLELDAHSLVSRVVWFAQRSDWYFRNDYTNLLNWKYTDPEKRPYTKAPNATTSSSGILIPGANKFILNTARILCAGNEIFEEKKADYFSDITPYITCVGNSYPYAFNGLLAPLANYPIYVYSFALSSSNPIQPSGTINLSRINLVELEINPYPIPIDANYTYNFNVYVESLNFLEIASGLGGMKFSI